MEETAIAVADTKDASEKLIKRYMLYSAGAGLVPAPFLDVAAITLVQVKMLSEMSKTYGIPFHDQRAKAIISSLIGGITASSLAYGVVGRVLRAIPGPGMLLGMLSMPIFASATTFAVGKVFIQHFESGGTFLDFNPDTVKTHFAEMFSVGKKAAITSPTEKK